MTPDGVPTHVRELERENRRLRRALHKIANDEHYADCDGLFAEPEGCFERIARRALERSES